MRAGVVELVALEVELAAPIGGAASAGEVLGQAFGEIKRAGPADIVLGEVVDLGLIAGVVLGGLAWRPRRPARPRE
jgi:hypothetical protein